MYRRRLKFREYGLLTIREYDKEPHNGFNATFCGAPKSGRKDLKAVTLGAGVQENKIPFFFQALSGNSSDAVWFRDALSEIASLFNGDLHSRPILIFDAAGSNQEMFEEASYKIAASSRFKKDLKLIIKRGYNIGLLDEVVTILAEGNST